MEKKFLCMSI